MKTYSQDLRERVLQAVDSGYPRAEIVQMLGIALATLKGTTARKVFPCFPEVKQHLWGGAFWSRSYSMGGVGETSVDTVLKYSALGQD